MNERMRTYLSYTLICGIWGSTWLAIKISLESVTPLLSAALRFLFASAVLFLITRIRGVEIPRHREARFFYLIVAFTSFSVPFGLVYWGEQYIPSGLASVLFAIYPFSVAIMSYLFLPAERVTSWKVGGIILGFAGIYTIFSHDLSMSGPNAGFGMAAVLLSAVLQSISVVVVKKLGGAINPIVITYVPMLYGAFILLAGSLLFEDVQQVQMTSRSLLSILYLGLFGSVVTFVSYFWLLKRVEAVVLSLTSFITPVLAVFLGVVLMREQISSQIFLGAGLVLSGIGVANAMEVKKLLLARGISYRLSVLGGKFVGESKGQSAKSREQGADS